jgi:hypothetical protein
MTAAEREITETVNEILNPWLASENDQSRRAYRQYLAEIDRFTAWLRSYGLELPVSGRLWPASSWSWPPTAEPCPN